jgi:hypothetical protein
VKQPVINVAVIRHKVRADELEFPVGESRQYFTLGTDDLPQVQNLFFNLQDFIESPLGRRLDNLAFNIGDLQRKLVQSRLVVLYDAVQEGVCDAIRRARHVSGATQTDLFSRLHGAYWHFVICDQKISSEEKIQLAGGKYTVFATVIDGMNHNEKIRRKLVAFLRLIFFDLGRRTDRNAIFDGERVKVKYALEDELCFLGGRLLQIYPKKKIRIRQKRGHEEHLDVSGMETPLGCECKRTNHAVALKKDSQHRGQFFNVNVCAGKDANAWVSKPPNTPNTRNGQSPYLSCVCVFVVGFVFAENKLSARGRAFAAPRSMRFAILSNFAGASARHRCCSPAGMLANGINETVLDLTTQNSTTGSRIRVPYRFVLQEALEEPKTTIVRRPFRWSHVVARTLPRLER